MNNFLKETFLYEYFLYDAMFGRFFDKQRVFDVLSDIFCIQKQDSNELLAMINGETVKEIFSQADYLRYARIEQYNSLVGNSASCSVEEEEAIKIKGEVLETLQNASLKLSHEYTKGLAIKSLMTNAGMGNVLSLRMLGLLQCEGILVDKTVEEGRKNLVKAMQWGDTVATLALFKYAREERPTLMASLKACVKNTPSEFFEDLAAKKYKTDKNVECSQEILLLRQAFNAKVFDQAKYDPMCARLVFSKIMKIKDKNRILFSEDSGALALACDLPLRLKFDEIKQDESAFCDMPVKREDEIAKIKSQLWNSDLRGADAFRPMCVCSASDYLLDVYMRATKNALRTSNITQIDVENLHPEDFAPTSKHVFVRDLNEKKNNVCMFVFKGAVDDDILEYVKGLLSTQARKQFNLGNLSATIDLSSVLPICFCDKANAAKLAGGVELVEIAPVKDSEKQSLVTYMIEEKKTVFKMNEITVDEKVVERLCLLKAEIADNVITTAVRENRGKGKSLNLSLELVKPYLAKKSGGFTPYGFGGGQNENQ